ncbi:MAG TPA: helix-turn-helix domain-containing protein [Myxococcota bacterium]|nr:helix-turn-helix domain-containing protein [Myxococcota bacterium]
MDRAPVALLTPDEVARRLRVSPRTVKDWRGEGCGPPFIKLGRLVRYSVVDLNAWLEMNVRLPLTAQQADERKRLEKAQKVAR